MIIREGIYVPVKNIKKDMKLVMQVYSYKNYRKDKIETTILYKDKYFIFPRNLDKLRNFIDINQLKDERIKNVIFSNTFSLNSSYKPYDFQLKFIEKILHNLNTKQGSCILKAPPGTGKTYILPYLVSKLGVKTLILVDRTNLVEQMYSEFKQNVKEGDIQILSSKSNRVADINIATLQLLNKNTSLIHMLKENIGFIIVDEAHLVSIGALTNVILQFPAYYRLGLSATPTRSDGLTEALYDHFGYNIVESDNPFNLEVQHLIIKHKESIYYSGKYDAGEEWRNLYKNLSIINDVIKLAIKLKKENNRTIFIYNTNQEVQELLKVFLEKEGFKAEIINANTKSKDRKRIIEDFSNEKIDFLISGVILQKGISIHRMDTIINYSNHTKESFEQMVGRLRRHNPKKKKNLIIHFTFGGKGEYKYSNYLQWINKLKKENNDKLIEWNYKKFINYLSPLN